MFVFFFFSSRRRHTRYWRDWSSDVCSSDLHRDCRRLASCAGLRSQHGPARLEVLQECSGAAPVDVHLVVTEVALEVVLGGLRVDRRGFGPELDTYMLMLQAPLAGEIGRASCRERV